MNSVDGARSDLVRRLRESVARFRFCDSPRKQPSVVVSEKKKNASRFWASVRPRFAVANRFPLSYPFFIFSQTLCILFYVFFLRGPSHFHVVFSAEMHSFQRWSACRASAMVTAVFIYLFGSYNERPFKRAGVPPYSARAFGVARVLRWLKVLEKELKQRSIICGITYSHGNKFKSLKAQLKYYIFSHYRIE